MALVKLYARGAIPQGIAKGFALCGNPEPARIDHLLRAVHQLSPISGRKVRATFDRRSPKAVWIDIGADVLHTWEARAAYFQTLAQAIHAAHDLAHRQGIALLPAALDPGSFHEPSVIDRSGGASDRHFLYPPGPTEREIICNRFRARLPELLALTGSSGIAEGRVHPTASLRMQRSTRHYTARYFGSVSATHLERVRTWMRRDEGIRDLSLLDIVPSATCDPSATFDPNAPDNLELRFIDAQSLLTSVWAQSILFQALAMRCCRVYEEGGREPNFHRATLERRRADAISRGMGAVLEVEAGAKGGPVRATRALLDLLSDLTPELRALEVEVEEISPLFMGAELREMGLPALTCDGDYQRHHLLRGNGTTPLHVLYPVLWGDALDLRRNAVVELNRSAAPTWCSVIEDAWRARVAAAASSALTPVSVDARAPIGALEDSPSQRHLFRLLFEQVSRAGGLGRLVDLHCSLQHTNAGQAHRLKSKLCAQREGALFARIHASEPVDWRAERLAPAVSEIRDSWPAVVRIKGKHDDQLRRCAEQLRCTAPPGQLAVLLDIEPFLERRGDPAQVMTIVFVTLARLA